MPFRTYSEVNYKKKKILGKKKTSCQSPIRKLIVEEKCGIDGDVFMPLID